MAISDVGSFKGIMRFPCLVKVSPSGSFYFSANFPIRKLKITYLENRNKQISKLNKQS
ncbi:hypothetical protein HanIR_Chr01g0034641 [Helianthus annuus]|nr:hypothetical protein HanIR_Chr01g0034641 [Helianthus annuus]